jgi:SAM-dependent methyltransferase
MNTTTNTSITSEPPKAKTTDASERQAALWGPRARDWAEVQEGQVLPLYIEVLERLGIATDARLLDVGCGAGGFLALAAGRGARVLGIDGTPELLEIARRRVPSAGLEHGDIETLPYADASFDIVTGLNAFQFAVDPARALREARRVVCDGGRVVVATWGMPNDCEAARYLACLKPLLPTPPPGARPAGPFALSDEAALREIIAGTGLAAVDVRDVACAWTYPDLETALRGLLAAGPPMLAIRTSGEEAVRGAVTEAIAPYRTMSGGYRMENKFRYLTATRVR